MENYIRHAIYSQHIYMWVVTEYPPQVRCPLGPILSIISENIKSLLWELSDLWAMEDEWSSLPRDQSMFTIIVQAIFWLISKYCMASSLIYCTWLLDQPTLSAVEWVIFLQFKRRFPIFHGFLWHIHIDCKSIFLWPPSSVLINLYWLLSLK